MSKEKISKYLLSSCSKNLKHRIEKFIFEETDEVFTKAELSKVKFYNFFLFQELDIFNKNKTLKKSEDTLTLKRLFTLGYKFCPEKLISDLNTFISRFSFYKDLGFSEEFIIKDVEENFKKDILNDILHFEILIGEVDKKFPKLLDNYLSSNSLKKNNYITTLILSRKITKEDFSKIDELEKFILVSLSEIYSKERIGDILKYDLEREDLLEIIKDTQPTESDDDFVEFLKKIYIGINSPNNNVILTLLEILSTSLTTQLSEIESPKEYFSYIESLNLPFIYKLIYLYQASENMNIYPYLKSFIKENVDSSEKLLNRMCLQNIELGSLMLEIISTQISKEKFEEYKKLYLEKVNSLIDKLNNKLNDELEVRLINTLGYMLTYSNVEKEISLLNEYYQKNKRDTNEFINLISHFENIIENSEKNPWNIISSNTSIDKRFLIVGTIDFVNIKSTTQFTKFLKENENLFYELLEKKIFIDVAFMEIMSYSYETDTNFDFSKLLPYLEVSDEFLLTKVFNLLKTKEKECSESINLLKKNRNKKILKNIAKLEKIWENFKVIDFKNIAELEEYCKNKLIAQKMDIPYSKNEFYGKVREKNSNRFIDESVVKYYVAINITNEDLENIPLGETIKNFLNLEDLRECIGEIYKVWLDNRMPSQYLIIVRVLSQIADEFWIEKLLTQCENLIANKKYKLAEDWITLMLVTQRKNTSTYFEYIHSKLQNPRIADFLDNHLAPNSTIFDLLDTIFKNSFDFSMGFDKNGEKSLNYGKREIKLVLDKNLNITIINQDGKEMKSLPKVSTKFEDNFERVEFYQKDFKQFKKRREFILNELKTNIFYQMIGDRSWDISSWKEEIEGIYIVRNFFKNIVLKILDSSNKEFIALYDEENKKFIDINSNLEIMNIEKIKIFYSGEYDKNQVLEIKKLVENKLEDIFNLQFEIEKVPQKDIIEFRKKEVESSKAFNVLENYYVNYLPVFLDNFTEKFILLNRLDKAFLEIDIVENTKGFHYIDNLHIYDKIKQEISIEKINDRFKNYILFILTYITID